MLILALDTATTDLVVGLVNAEAGAVVAETIHEGSRGHNELLVPTILTLLENNQRTFDEVAAIVVGQGPGPFTGLRVGLATAAALGDARGIPVYGVCTHDAIAAQAGYPEELLVVTDARRKEVYWSFYRGRERIGPQVSSPQSLGYLEAPVSYPPHLGEVMVGRRAVGPFRPTAWGLVTAALPAMEAGAPAPVVPLYLRRPDAKEPAVKPRSSAIPEGFVP